MKQTPNMVQLAIGGDIGFDAGGETSGACRERQRLSLIKWCN